MPLGPRASDESSAPTAPIAVAAGPVQARRERVRGWGWVFGALTVLPALLAAAWLLPALPLVLASRFTALPMVLMFAPLAVGLCYLGFRRMPRREGVPWWVVGATVAVAVAFAGWQIWMRTQQIIYLRDPSTYLEVGYWIAHHGSLPVPQSLAAFGGSHPGLSFASSNYYPRGTGIVPQFMTGFPAVVAAAIWIGGIPAALVITPIAGGCAILSFAGLAGRLIGPRWAPAAAAVLALSLPEIYTSRSTFSEPLAQVLLFGGLSLLADSFVQRRARTEAHWAARVDWAAGLAGLILGLTIFVRLDGLSDILPVVPFLGILLAARQRQAIPFGIGLVIGVGYGILDGYQLSRPYLNLEAPSLHPLALITAVVVLLTVIGVVVALDPRLHGWLVRQRPPRQATVAPRGERQRASRSPGSGGPEGASRPGESVTASTPGRRGGLGGVVFTPQKILPEAGALLTLVVFVAFAVRPLVQKVAGETDPTSIAYVAELQRIAHLPVDGKQQYYQDSLYWVIWYIGVPAVLVGAFGLAALMRQGVRALLTWKDPDGTARVWALPLMIALWVIITVLWRPAVSPDQPWASRRLVPFVIPGLILGAIWASNWLKSRATQLDAGRVTAGATACCCVLALAGPTAWTTFGVGLTPRLTAHGMAFKRVGSGETTAVMKMCVEIGADASVVILDQLTADRFAQVVRGICGTPAAVIDHPTTASVGAVVAGIRSAGRRPVLLAQNASELTPYGGAPTEVVNLLTTQEAHLLNSPPSRTWRIHYTVWMSGSASTE